LVNRDYSIRSRKYVKPDLFKTVRELREIVFGMMGSVSIGQESSLKYWTQGKCYEPLTIGYDIDGNVLTAGVKWPDGNSGVLTMTDWNSDEEVYDGYNVTHVLSGKTITQAAVTRNEDGMIIIKPPLSVV
jgi:hypothetical protein